MLKKNITENKRCYPSKYPSPFKWELCKRTGSKAQGLGTNSTYIGMRVQVWMDKAQRRSFPQKLPEGSGHHLDATFFRPHTQSAKSTHRWSPTPTPRRPPKVGCSRFDIWFSCFDPWTRTELCGWHVIVHKGFRANLKSRMWSIWNPIFAAWMDHKEPSLQMARKGHWLT